MHSLVNQMRNILPSTKNLHMIMRKSQPWTWSHLQMVLWDLIKLVGRHLMIQRMLLWLTKHILSPFRMKVVLVLLLKWEDSNWTKKGPEVSLEPEPFWISMFTSSAFVGSSAKRSVSTNLTPSLSLNTNSPTLMLLLLQYLQIQFPASLNACFLPFWMLGSNTNKGGGDWTEEEEF